MVFSSIDFIFGFLPVFLLIYAVCPFRWKNLCLFAGSLFFYYSGVKENPSYLFLFLCSIGVNYILGILIGNRKRERKKWLIIGIIYNFFWLFLFKYSGFFIQNLNGIVSFFGLPVQIPAFEPVLPIGISFYTFQNVSYLADVYRRRVSFERSFTNYGMYISMFPQLIAGPIVTYSSVRSRIRKRKSSLKMIESGLRQFTIGLGLKVLIANQIGGLWKNVEAIGFESISTPLAWLGLVSFSLQIYFDFYGYSLMAKGLGNILGFRFPRNFSHPYLSTSMTEFWRRWHITLGSWFREYVYIPLGGNREGFWKTTRNLLVVWLLTGFWHGASWNFILWGLVLFLLIFLEKLGLGKLFARRPMAGHIYMLFAIPFTWMLFAITDLSQIAIYFQRLFPFLAQEEEFTYFTGDFLKYAGSYALSLCAGLIFITPVPKNLYNRWKNTPVSALILLIVFWGCVYCMKMGMDDPFLYFRF